jgi:hypothetical protein
LLFGTAVVAMRVPPRTERLNLAVQHTTHSNAEGESPDRADALANTAQKYSRNR